MIKFVKNTKLIENLFGDILMIILKSHTFKSSHIYTASCSPVSTTYSWKKSVDKYVDNYPCLWGPQ